jgi:hypothetical protein
MVVAKINFLQSKMTQQKVQKYTTFVAVGLVVHMPAQARGDGVFRWSGGGRALGTQWPPL